MLCMRAMTTPLGIKAKRKLRHLFFPRPKRYRRPTNTIAILSPSLCCRICLKIRCLIPRNAKARNEKWDFPTGRRNSSFTLHADAFCSLLHSPHHTLCPMRLDYPRTVVIQVRAALCESRKADVEVSCSDGVRWGRRWEV